MRSLEQGDDVRHHAAVARGSLRDGYALIQSEQLTARIAHCGQFALIGFVRNDDADILQHPRKPFRQIIQHLFNGPFKLIVTDVHTQSFTCCLAPTITDIFRVPASCGCHNVAWNASNHSLGRFFIH